MARTIPAGLVTQLASGRTTLARCLRLDLRDGTSLGITTLNEDIDVDLGDGSLTYRADTGVLPSALKLAVGLEADNFEASGPISDDVTRPAVMGGRFDRARARLFDVNYRDPSQIIALMTGRVTARRVEGGKFVFEVRSASDAFNQTIGGILTPYCQTDFGSGPCGVTLEPPAWSAGLTAVARADWDAKVGTVVSPSVFNGFFYEASEAGVTGGAEPAWPTVAGATVTDGSVTWTARTALTWPATVTSVSSDMQFTVGFSAGAPAADYFNDGTVSFITGDLAGTLPVEVFDYGSGVVTLLVPLAEAPQIGDTLKLRAGCPRTRAGCRSYRNTWNMVMAFPDVPGSDDYLKFNPPG